MPRRAPYILGVKSAEKPLGHLKQLPMFMYRGFFYLVGAHNRNLPKARRQVQRTPQIKNQVPYVRVNYKN
jgi:hypothetical protein